MQQALHLKTEVLPGKKVEVESEELSEGDTVEVIVLLPKKSSLKNAQKQPSQSAKLLSESEIKTRLDAVEKTSGIWLNLPDNGWEERDE